VERPGFAVRRRLPVCRRAGNGIAGSVFRCQANEQIALDVGFPSTVDVMRIKAFGLAAIAAIDVGARRRVRRTRRNRQRSQYRCNGPVTYRFQEARDQTSTMRRSRVM
jgi:hypothetical protein